MNGGHTRISVLFLILIITFSAVILVLDGSHGSLWIAVSGLILILCGILVNMASLALQKKALVDMSDNIETREEKPGEKAA